MRKFLLGSLALLAAALGTLPVEARMAPKRSVLDNGIVLLTSEQRALPMVSIELLIDAGSRYDAANQAGQAYLASKLLSYGTKRRGALQISETLDFIGASLETGCGQEAATISMTLLKKDLATGLDLLADVLTSSTFPQAEIERQKQAIVASIRAKQEDPSAVAQQRFSAVLFPDSPYGRPVEGAEASVKALSQRGLQEFFARHYRPNRTIVSVVGDVSEEEISRALAQAFRAWQKGAPGAEFAAPAKIGASQTVRVQKDLTQAHIILGHIGLPRSHPDYYALQVMNYILGGGGFSSRAMDSIRNERGLAYSVYTFFGANKSSGYFEFVMQTKNETAEEAIRLALQEMGRMRDEPVSEEELSDAKNYMTGSFPLRFDTNSRVANFLAQVEFFGLGLDYPDRYGEIIGKVTRADVQRVAKLYLQPDKIVTVIIGNQKKIGAK
jgi:zinc protease